MMYVVLILMKQYVAEDHINHSSVEATYSRFTKQRSIANYKTTEVSHCTSSYSETHLKLKEHVQAIQKTCGELCDTSLDHIIDFKRGHQKHFDYLSKKVNCGALWGNSAIDEASHSCASPMKIPEYLHDNFTYNGQIQVLSSYHNEKKLDDNKSKAVRVL